MTAIASTQVFSVALTTTPTLIWATPASRVGIEVYADIANGAVLCVARVAAGASAPTRPSRRIPAGKTLIGDNRWSTSVDVYWWMESGTGVGDASEMQN